LFSYINIMNVKIPQYNIASPLEMDMRDTDKTDFADLNSRLLSSIRREASRFLYEPMNGEMLGRIKDSILHAVQDRCEAVSVGNIEIDDMRDLEFKKRECEACAETSSYEEYKLKRAVLNLPDEAGSEKEWFRMSQYRPGSVNVNIDFVPFGQSVQEIEYTAKLC